MNGCEAKTLREKLGLPSSWVARRLDVNPRTLDRWEASNDPAKPDHADLLLRANDDWEQMLDDLLDEITVVQGEDDGVVDLLTYASDAALLVKHEGFTYPARFHRSMMRAAFEVLDADGVRVRLTY